MSHEQPVAQATRHFEVVIIGAGASGIGMAIRLLNAGIESFVLLESASDLGGVWRQNTYPGCACDIPSGLYSFSFELRTWSRIYSQQPEIRGYLKHCAEKYGLHRYIRFDTRVAGAEFDEVAGRWTVHTSADETFSGRALVSCVGGLNRPAIPDIPGLAGFRGRAFHSAAWADDYDLDGKRVAVIGTGASAIQLIPHVARQARRLHVFQRTPHWIVPRKDRPLTAWEKRMLTHLPGLRRLYRYYIYWKYEIRLIGLLGYTDGVLKRFTNDALEFIERSIDDPAIRAAVTPSYVIGCKRVLFSNDYYPSLNRDNVELVTDHIAEVRPTSIVTADGKEREVDAIIFGTGFQARDFLVPMRIRGLAGKELHDVWRDYPHSYLGIAVSGFPNFFVIYGPNTSLGHNSMLFQFECQIHYALQAIRKLRKEKLRYLDVRAGAQKAFVDEVNARMTRTVWSSGGCKSWYLNEDGTCPTLWPGFTFDYWWRTRRIRSADFECRGFEDRPAAGPAAP
jgi:cation diffusion facilitator CzcD-associated flavoprotein CzcO